MNHRLCSILAFAAAPLAAAEPLPQQLTITAATPKVAIAPQIPGRQLVPLPDLEYHFLLEPRCAPGWTPRSITLSIADSRTVLQAEVLDEHGFTETRLAIPAAQLAPVPVSGFCEAAKENAATSALPVGNAEMRFSAAVSLHAALICSNAEAERISYVSRPLGLTFQCAPPLAAAAESEAPE
jgi:hypothetical protein